MDAAQEPGRRLAVGAGRHPRRGPSGRCRGRLDPLQSDHDRRRAGSEGEREPRSKWILALLGAVCLAAGYLISLRTNVALYAIQNFFPAVILVIIGTYLTFIALSIVVLKALRKNRRYYYKTSHFATVSGLIYRMSRNAADGWNT